MIDQKREYRRHAEVTKFSIDTSPLEKLADEYYMFVTANKVYAQEQTPKDLDLSRVVSKYVANKSYYRFIKNCVNQAVICFLPRQELKVEYDIFQDWYEKQINRGTVIPLITMLNQTLSFCTTPYLHEVKRVYLGDPLRTNDKAVRKLS